MKRLVLVFLLISNVGYVQIRVDKCNSFLEDKQLAKQLFDRVNLYRNSLGEASYTWNETCYESAKQHNDYLAANGLWGHTNQPVQTELIVAVNNIRQSQQSITPDVQQMIIDSCIQQWIHSEWHHKTMIAPLATKTKTTHSISISGINLDIMLSKYGAISVNILRYANYVHVTCIMHLTQ